MRGPIPIAFFLALCGLFAPACAEPPARFLAVDTLLYRGAVPLHREEFEFLAKVGIKSIISVDRSQPDRATADSVGLRYAHIPIGYGKVERGAQLDFLKALTILPGPFYVHCHAGKYRAGAMSAIYRVARNGWRNDSAFKEMLSLGGKDVYMGLNYSVLSFKPPTARELEKHAFDPDKPRDIPELAEQMGEIGHFYQEMEKFIAARLDTLEMESITLALEERYWEIDRLQLCKPCDSTGYAAMRSAARHVQEMRLTGEYTDKRFDIITQDCRSCHVKMRDVMDNVETVFKMRLDKLMLDFK